MIPVLVVSIKGVVFPNKHNKIYILVIEVEYMVDSHFGSKCFLNGRTKDILRPVATGGTSLRRV